MGEDGWTGTLLTTPTPTMVKLASDRLPHPIAYLQVKAQGPQVKAGTEYPRVQR